MCLFRTAGARASRDAPSAQSLKKAAQQVRSGARTLRTLQPELRVKQNAGPDPNVPEAFGRRREAGEKPGKIHTGAGEPGSGPPR